jgi:hypothetical protein
MTITFEQLEEALPGGNVEDGMYGFYFNGLWYSFPLQNLLDEVPDKESLITALELSQSHRVIEQDRYNKYVREVEDKLPEYMQSSIRATVNQTGFVRFCLDDYCTDYMDEETLLDILYSNDVDTSGMNSLESFQQRFLVFLVTTFNKLLPTST